MTDPIADIIGDYRAFAAQQRDRLLARGIDIAPFELSHLAFRVPEWDQYVHVRTLLERHASANSENVWNGRPISLILHAEPLEVLDGKAVPMIELIPPVHQRVYRMGLEHLGVVVGDGFDAFVEAHSPSSRDSSSKARTADPTPCRSCSRTSPREVPSTVTAGVRRARCRPGLRRVPPRR